MQIAKAISDADGDRRTDVLMNVVYAAFLGIDGSYVAIISPKN